MNTNQPVETDTQRRARENYETRERLAKQQEQRDLAARYSK